MFHIILMSPSAWKEWIEIVHAPRIPLLLASPSAWKEWIEILGDNPSVKFPLSPSAWKEWIEISHANMMTDAIDGLLPHGRSGLKYTASSFLCD